MTANVNTNFDSLTTTVDAPALRYPPLAGVVGSNQAPDAGDAGVVIPLRLTSYSAMSRKQNPQSGTVMPIINPNNGGFAIGGKFLGPGTQEMPKAQLEGYIDTPCTVTTVGSESLNLPIPTFNSMSVTFADLIAAYMEGRANLTNPFLGGGVSINNMWTRVNPTWFRDHAGRVYNNPTIVAFTAAYVEAVPGRTTFQMTLQVGTYGG